MKFTLIDNLEQGKLFFRVVTCFLFNVLLSVGVMFHSYFYLQEKWDADKAFLVVPFILLIEAVYVLLPYLNMKEKNWIDWFLLASFFLLSITPAGLGSTSSYFDTKKKYADLSIEPIAPKKSPLIADYRRQVQENDEQIKQKTAQVNGLLDKNFITRGVLPINEAIGQLTKLNASLLTKISQKEEEHEKKFEEYEARLITYNKSKNEQEIEYWVEIIWVWWSFLLIILFQAANAKMIHEGSQAMYMFIGEYTRLRKDRVSRYTTELESKLHLLEEQEKESEKRIKELQKEEERSQEKLKLIEEEQEKQHEQAELEHQKRLDELKTLEALEQKRIDRDRLELEALNRLEIERQKDLEKTLKELEEARRAKLQELEEIEKNTKPVETSYEVIKENINNNVEEEVIEEDILIVTEEDDEEGEEIEVENVVTPQSVFISEEPTSPIVKSLLTVSALAEERHPTRKRVRELDVKKLLLDHKTRGIGESYITQMIETFNIYTATNLKEFLSTDFKGQISKKFPGKIADGLVRTCEGVYKMVEYI